MTTFFIFRRRWNPAVLFGPEMQNSQHMIWFSVSFMTTFRVVLAKPKFRPCFFGLEMQNCSTFIGAPDWVMTMFCMVPSKAESGPCFSARKSKTAALLSALRIGL